MKRAYREANAFCESDSKVMQPISTRSKPVTWDSAAYFDLTFLALDPDDPEYRRPVLESAPSATIEVRSK